MTNPTNSNQTKLSTKASFLEEQTTLLSSLKEILIKLRKETKAKHTTNILRLIDKIEGYNNPQMR